MTPATAQRLRGYPGDTDPAVYLEERRNFDPKALLPRIEFAICGGYGEEAQAYIRSLHRSTFARLPEAPAGWVRLATQVMQVIAIMETRYLNPSEVEELLASPLWCRRQAGLNCQRGFGILLSTEEENSHAP